MHTRSSDQFQFTFEWDTEKNILNIEKHGVSFEEAKTIFYDPNVLYMYDPFHSDNEERFYAIGISEKLNVLIVSHCYRDEGKIIRIISARKADKNDERVYNNNRR